MMESTAVPRSAIRPTATTKRLIVNADDFGYTIGVNRGIIEAHRDGILTSTTIMPNAAAFEDAVARSREHPNLGVGVHVNVVEGTAVSDPQQIPSMLRNDGQFHSKAAVVVRHLTGRLRLTDLRQEVAAQVDRVVEAGLTPTHLDSHQHIHTYPPFLSVFLEIAESRGISAMRLPLERPRLGEVAASPTALPRLAVVAAMCQLSRRRVRRSGVQTSDAFTGVLKTGSVTSHWLLDVLRSLRHGVTEVMVHPGHCDDDLATAPTRLTVARETELRAITDPEVIDYVCTAGIELTNYGHLAAPNHDSPLHLPKST